MTKTTDLRRGAALLLVMGVAACGAAQGERQDGGLADDVVPVRVAPVREEVVAREVTGTGVLGAKEEIDLGFKVGGVIARVLVHEGETVRRGQLLATLNPAEIDAGVRQAESAAEKAERDLARARRLYADSVVTLSQLQDAETAAEVARAALAAARFNRRYAAIVAPTDGVIVRRSGEAGELAAPGSPILVLASEAAPWVVRVGVADRDVGRVRPGDPAEVRFAAVPGEVLRGRVTQVAAAAQPQTGTYEVEVTLEGPRGRAALGMIGEVRLRPSAGERLRVVPVGAIAEADGAAGAVYALSSDGRHARRVPVSIAFIDGDRVAVRGGLEEVARVVTAGAAYLSDGAAVRVVP